MRCSPSADARPGETRHPRPNPRPRPRPRPGMVSSRRPGSLRHRASRPCRRTRVPRSASGRTGERRRAPPAPPSPRVAPPPAPPRTRPPGRRRARRRACRSVRDIVRGRTRVCTLAVAARWRSGSSRCTGGPAPRRPRAIARTRRQPNSPRGPTTVAARRRRARPEAGNTPTAIVSRTRQPRSRQPPPSSSRQRTAPSDPAADRERPSSWLFVGVRFR